MGVVGPEGPALLPASRDPEALGAVLHILLRAGEAPGWHAETVRAYNSCGFWIQPVEKVADEAEQLLAGGNFGAVKKRVGRDDPAQDLAAARAAKKRIGNRIHVMSDFNQRLTAAEAIQRGHMLDDEGLYWIEEPTRHDHYEGYARTCAELDSRLQPSVGAPCNEAEIGLY